MSFPRHADKAGLRPSTRSLPVVLATDHPDIDTADDYDGGEVLAEQAGAGNVLTFTFSAPVQLVVVEAESPGMQVARADPFGGEPDATTGIPCRSEVPVYMPITTTEVKVWAPGGTTVNCWGYRRA